MNFYESMHKLLSIGVVTSSCINVIIIVCLWKIYKDRRRG